VTVKSLCLLKHQFMKECAGVEAYLHVIFLMSVLNGGQWPALRISCFPPEEGARESHCIGGWVDRIATLNAAKKRKSPASAKNRTPIPRVVQPVT
jgi:hypothetical protein